MPNKPLQDITPPQNLEAEQAFLGALLIDKDAIIKVADIITPDDFYSEKHKLIFQSILDLYQERDPIDVLSLSNRLTEKNALDTIGGKSYLITLANAVPSAANINSYANIIQKKATLRRLIQAGHEILSIAHKDEETVTEQLDDAERSLFAVSQRHLKQNFIPIADILTEAFDRIDEIHKESGKLRGIPTGFVDLDNLLGGLQNADLLVLAARPSMGKTSLVLDIVRQVAVSERIPVGVFSLEMSRDQLVDRLLCSQAGVDLWRMRTGHLSDSPENDDFPRIGQAMGILSEAPIFIDDSAMTNVMEIRTKARRLQMEHGLGLIVIDYLQLMEGKAGTENRVQEIAQISRGLKGLARELNVPIIALSQLSRAVEAQNVPIPKLAHLRESGCVLGSTRIINAETGQLVKIQDIAEKQLSFRTFTVNTHLRLEKKQLKKAWASGVKSIYELRTASGRTIQASANHPFHTIQGWKRLDELDPNECIAIPRECEPGAGGQLDNNRLILLAHLIGDGCFVRHQPLHYTNADELNIASVEQAAKAAFPTVVPRTVVQKTWYHLYLPGKHPQQKRHNPIMMWLNELGLAGKRSYEKFIPDVVFQLPRPQQALFLRHLWATDGSVTKNQKTDKVRIYYASSSRQLIDDVAHLLLRFGIIGRIKSSQKDGYKPTYSIDVYGANHQTRFLAQIGCSGHKDGIATEILFDLVLKKTNTNVDVVPKNVWKQVEQGRIVRGMSTRGFHTIMNWQYSGTARHQSGISRPQLEKIVQVIDEPALQDLAESDVFWDKIVTIEPKGEAMVYDAEIEDNHNFVANDIIVHNSIEQDADVVMFIYREEYYKPDTDRKNIAEVFIAKHRNGPTGKIELYFDMKQASFANLEKVKYGAPPPSFPDAPSSD